MKKLLVVIDMQNDFIEGTLGSEEAVEIVPRVAKKIQVYLKERQDVVYTMDTHYEDYLQTLEGLKLPVPHCIKDSGGWQLHPAIKGLIEGAMRFEKNTFGSMEFAVWVMEQGYDEVELVGLCTDICVISNAMLLKASLPNTPVSVDARCCAGVTPATHQNALEAMKMCQIDII